MVSLPNLVRNLQATLSTIKPCMISGMEMLQKLIL